MIVKVLVLMVGNGLIEDVVIGLMINDVVVVKVEDYFENVIVGGVIVLMGGVCYVKGGMFF